ncbi:hypothetical protein Tco_0925136 [Tanacetum coccineum]|uniref:Integrase, catalytic region, zinc finger, CCHC-type, peptidase aspartic, catalytic n=1 Tax=Tanacetum coccineum TaxID=301880 RepID=A0ABQ5D7D2_9ASTR
MANLSEDIQCVGSDTLPLMLDRTDFSSWQQRIRLWELFGKQLLKGLPKDIYSLINHYTDAKDIWDNVKMLLEGSELTKEDRESQPYDDFEHFRQNKGETIHDCYVWFAKLINDMQNIKTTMSRMQLNSKFVNNMLPEWGRFSRQNKGQGNNARGAGAAGYGGAQNRIGNANPGQAMQNGVALDEEQLLFIAGGQDNAVDEDVDEQHVQDLALWYRIFTKGQKQSQNRQN